MKLLKFPEPLTSPLKRYQDTYAGAFRHIEDIVTDSPLGVSDDGRHVYLYFAACEKFRQERQLAMTPEEFKQVVLWGAKLLGIKTIEEPTKHEAIVEVVQPDQAPGAELLQELQALRGEERELPAPNGAPELSSHGGDGDTQS